MNNFGGEEGNGSGAGRRLYHRSAAEVGVGGREAKLPSERDPDKYLEGWPEELWRDEAERFYGWLKAQGGRTAKTLYNYLYALKGAFEKLGKNPRELALEDVYALLPKLGVHEVKVLKLYIKFLWKTTREERWRAIYEEVKIRNRKPGLPEALTREQVERLLEACGRVDFELKALVGTVYETGARVQEILALRGRDVEFDEYGARLYIRRSKSSARTVRVSLYANLLAAWLEARRPAPDERVFPRGYWAYHARLRKAWRLAGLPPTRQPFHILRHTRATELLKSRTFTEKEMMLWFGWRTRSMIDVYAKVTMQDVEEAYLAAVKGAEVKREEPPKPKACPRCGALNPPEARFCYRCAAPLTPEAQRQALARETEIQAQIVEMRRMLEEVLRKIGEHEERLRRE
jgi:integrase/ribosomal protein L40E